MKSCLIIAGEKSGEEHASSFFSELKRLTPDVHYYGVGGEYLKEEGVELLYHLKDFSSMGFSEVLGKIPFYFRALKSLETEVRKRGTNTAIVIDFQDFNLRLARKLARRGVRVLYYVAPQAWAWKPYRAKVLATSAKTLFTILPFEKEWFRSRGVKQVKAIPHPLMKTFANDLNDIPERPYGSWNKKLKLLLLPGSRRAEIKSLLPEFIETVKELRKKYPVEVHLVKVGHISDSLYKQYENFIDVTYSSEEIVKAMKECHFCLAASGTVTLSTGLFELPTVVAYKTSLLNEFIFYNFINYKGDISLTNIIHGHRVFPEFTQERAARHNFIRALKTWIEDENAYNKVKADLKETKSLLKGDDFSIAHHMAEIIHE
jgi:lipid-A-disaccharide synthase